MRKRILLVDDDQAVQRLVTMTLGTTDFEVMVASDGATALEMAHAQPPDLVLLDVMMPDLDGFGVAAELRARPETADVTIIMLTARGSADDLAQSRALGVKEHFIKPFSPLHLLETVYDVLESPPPAKSQKATKVAG